MAYFPGTSGADTLTGTLDADTFVVNNVGDVVYEASANGGIDEVESYINSYTLTTNVENLELIQGSSARYGYGNSSDNTITGNSYDNSIYGYDGNDLLDGGSGADILVGGNGNDTLIGGTGDDALTGNDGDDTFYGGDGNDSMIGWAGNDTYYVTEAGDYIRENANEGTDTVFSAIGGYTLPDNFENLDLQSGYSGYGNSLNNNIIGNADNNYLSGGAGDDILEGYAGDDGLDGGVGADDMRGDTGDDTYYVDDSGDVVTEYSGEGTDTVNSSITYTLGSNVENLTLTGTSAINGTGNSSANTMTGNSGNNTLDGGTGADTMIGGVGDDTYYVDDAGDVVTEYSGEGTDTLYSSIDYTFVDNIENLFLGGSSNINVTGNSGNNTITGNSGNNILDGSAGNDTIDGGTGVDTMIGGTGDDAYYVDDAGDVITEYSGEGTDFVNSSITYTLGSNLENLTLTGTSNINGTGNSSANTMTGNSGDNCLWGLTGNDYLVGGDGNDILEGGVGVDTMIGGTGDDMYYIQDVGDSITENAGEGTDLVKSWTNYTLGANLENLNLYGTSNISGTGNELNNTIYGDASNNALYGMDGNDYLNGAAGADTLYGGAGNDTLDANVGDDTLYGGTGDDTYYIQSTSSTITENSGEGTDSVESYVTHTLASNVENLTLKGTSAINGTGNSSANTMTGNSGNNIFYGGAGNDYIDSSAGNDIIYAQDGNDTIIGGTGNDYLEGGSGTDSMTGGTGDDIYFVDNAGDVIVENAGEGTDTVKAYINYTIGDTIENLTLMGGVNNINGTGNSLDNTIYGNAGNNIIYGLGGNDTINSAEGNDIIYGGAGNDNINGHYGDDEYQFSIGDGIDSITDTSGTDKISLQSDVDWTDTAFFRSYNVTGTDTYSFTSDNLNMDYGTTVGDDQITVTNQFNGNTVERVEENYTEGTPANHYLTDSDINTIVQYIAAYDAGNGTTDFTSVEDVKNDSTLMAYISGQWHT